MKRVNTSRVESRWYSLAQHPIGRWCLTGWVLMQRARASWVERGPGLLKRGCDVVLSAAALVCLAPLFGLLALLIKLEDRGPVVFSQTRVGKFGRRFTMYKFRSMCANAEQRLADVLGRNQHAEGVTFKLKDDPRLTTVGRWMRKFSLDELPQFYNVLRGDMSLVGPRPPLPREVAMYLPTHRRRLAATPGITCLWQISGRSNIDFSGQVQLDVDYIENQGLWTDLKILVRTVPAVLSGKGAC